MKKILLASMAFVALLGSSCQNNDPSVDTAQTVTTLKAQLAPEHSRVAFTKPDGKFFWTAEDNISVNMGGTITKMTLTEGAGTALGTFSTTARGELESYVLYPHNENHQIDGSWLQYFIPKSQYYTADMVDSDFPSEMSTTVQGHFRMPMLGAIKEDGHSVSFQNLGAVLCVKLKNLTAQNYLLLLESSNPVSNAFKVYFESAGPNISTSTGRGGDECKQQIQLDNDIENPKTTAVVYFPLPTGVYNKLKVEIIAPDPNDPSIYSTVTSFDLGNTQISRCQLIEKVVDLP